MAFLIWYLLAQPSVSPLADPITIIGGGAAVSLIAVLVFAIVRVLRTYQGPINAMQTELGRRGAELEMIRATFDADMKRRALEIEDLRRQNRLSDWRIAILVATIQQAGIKVPDEVWRDGPPHH